MTLASKLGASYEKNKEQAKIKKFTLEIGEASFDLRVRIPVKREMEELLERISKPAPELIERIYESLAVPLRKNISEGGKEFEEALAASENAVLITDNDVLVQGTSVREVATFSAMWQTKVEAYFHLLQSETGDPINETYEQIAEEFPEAVIKQLVDDIESAIKPDYKTAKKN
jgi:hypothetical protein